MPRTHMPERPDYNKNVKKNPEGPKNKAVPQYPMVERKPISISDAETGLPGIVRRVSKKTNMP